MRITKTRMQGNFGGGEMVEEFIAEEPKIDIVFANGTIYSISETGDGALRVSLANEFLSVEPRAANVVHLRQAR